MTNIVFLVKNRLKLTEQGLKSLYDHTDRTQFNLTIVDDASDDFRVRDLLASYADTSNATLIRIEKSAGVLSRAKNIGVAWSEQTFGRGDWLYLSDCDVFYTDAWLDKLTDLAAGTEGGNFRLWGGQIHPFHKPVARGSTGCMYLHGNIVSSEWTEHSVLDGPSWLMRWETWGNCGPFDRNTAPGVCQSEEYPFCHRLTSIGGTAEFNENTTIYHGGRIGVIQPHVVHHTGVTQTDGKPAPGYAERLAASVPGVLYL